jgi:hypothetical protein
MGSVRAARERLAAGLDPRLAGPADDGIDSHLTRPQWPLYGSNESQSSLPNRTPPQRPPRPSYVPSILDSSRTQEQMVEYNQSQQQGPVSQQAKYWEPNYVLSPGPPSTPGTGISSSSSRDSAGSSVGSIPDFPVPALPVNPPAPLQSRRSGNLGPPPSARRGASSYYSQSSYVAPIPEETFEMPIQRPYKSKQAFRETNQWEDDTIDFYDSRPSEDLDDRDSRDTDPDEVLGLVRSASLGKQYKPSLTTVRPSNEALRQTAKQGYPPPKPTEVDPSTLANETMVYVESIHSDDVDGKSRDGDSMEGTTFLRNASEESNEYRKEALLGEKSISPLSSSEKSPSRSPAQPNVDPRVEQILGGLEKGGVIASGITPPSITPPSISPNPRKPPPLDLDRVRDAEARGSLTSLSDLIRRATKVKNNLEKGRTASRLGMLDYFSSSNPNLLKVAESK